jgi:hypothetical protein
MLFMKITFIIQHDNGQYFGAGGIFFSQPWLAVHFDKYESAEAGIKELLNKAKDVQIPIYYQIQKYYTNNVSKVHI